MWGDYFWQARKHLTDVTLHLRSSSNNHNKDLHKVLPTLSGEARMEQAGCHLLIIKNVAIMKSEGGIA